MGTCGRLWEASQGVRPARGTPREMGKRASLFGATGEGEALEDLPRLGGHFLLFAILAPLVCLCQWPALDSASRAWLPFETLPGNSREPHPSSVMMSGKKQPSSQGLPKAHKCGEGAFTMFHLWICVCGSQIYKGINLSLPAQSHTALPPSPLPCLQPQHLHPPQKGGHPGGGPHPGEASSGGGNQCR